ncbi:MAG: hypothetical protein J5772_02455 [Clostridia bacterium]|nr:hypothetical protein [Clostridia bacterium]
MEDTLLIIMLAVLVVAGFAAILFFSGLLGKKRRNKAEIPAPVRNDRPAEKEGLLDEYDRLGIIRFDKTGKAEDPAHPEGEKSE